MIDGRFDNHLFEIFIEARDKEGEFDATPVWPPAFFALAAVLAVVCLALLA